MVQGLPERILNAEKIDAWFEDVGEVQYSQYVSFTKLYNF